jgi:hypothetical protein
MTIRQKRFLEKWNRIRQQGKWRFVLKNAVLFGIFLALTTTFINVWLEGRLDWTTLSEAFSAKSITLSAAIFFLTGCWQADWQWKMFEEYYQSLSTHKTLK